MLEFDAETTKLLDEIYQGSDFVRRRMANFNALAPVPGDTILDIGCGPGLQTLELARAVGSRGKVIGIDPSADMRAAAARRCDGRGNIEIVGGTADKLPLDDDSADKAVSLQVFEYLEDIPAALRETARVLRKRGRLVVGDIHWDTFIWHSDDPKRMKAMMTSWDKHVLVRCVPEILPAMLVSAGFEVETVTPLPFVDTSLRSDGLASMIMILMRAYAKEHGHLPGKDADAWFANLEDLAAKGRFFFSLTNFVISARKR